MVVLFWRSRSFVSTPKAFLTSPENADKEKNKTLKEEDGGTHH